MTWMLKRAISHWLLAERQGSEQEADRALMRAFAGLPAPALPQGFADRVLSRVGLMPQPRRDLLLAGSWPVRGLLALCLLLAGLSALLLPSALPSILGVLSALSLTDLGIETVVEIFERFGSGLLVWRALSGVGRVLTGIFEYPAIQAALLLCALTGVGAFRLLYGLMVPQRSPRYVGSP